jgi:hypothetical protein
LSASLLRTEENQESCKYRCAIGFAASYGVLVLVQAALVFAPGRPLRLVSSRGLGLTIPAAALIVGVTVAQIGGGADFLTALAAVATPLLAAGAGWARGWRLPWLDFAAPALLGLLAQRRVVAGVAMGLAAGLWGLLLLATSPIAATPPVLVGLIAGRKPPRSTATVETTQGGRGVDGRRGLEA